MPEYYALWLVAISLLVLAFPVIAIIGLVVALKTRERLRLVELSVEKLARGLAATEATAAREPLPNVEPPKPSPALKPPQAPLPSFTSEPELVREPPRRQPVEASVPPIPTRAPQRAPSLEERFGTQWVVWTGGIAMAFGGFFLVRFSIEQGWFGPAVRVFLGALLAVALIVSGEGSRRKEMVSRIVGLPTADIPSILTAAGTSVAYADVWAAYGLYDFIGALTAFVLLAVVAFATLAAALLHGPALAGLGLVGAYATPLIVASEVPNYWALSLYVAMVTAAAFALARVRLWRWLVLTAIVFGFSWTFPGLADTRVDWLTPHDFQVAAGFVLAALFIVSGFLFGPDALPGRIDAVSSVGLAAYLLASTAIVLASSHDPLALATYAALVAATVGIAWRAESATAAVPAAAALTIVVFVHWALRIVAAHLIAPSGSAAPGGPEPAYVDYTWHLILGTFFGSLFAVTGFLAQGRSERPIGPMLWSASAVFAPIAILAVLYYRIAGFDRSVPFAAVALLIAVAFTYATEALGKREPRPGMVISGAFFAIGAAAALVLALTMTLEKGWLTVGLALMVPGIAWIASRRPFPVLRWLTAAVVLLVLLRVGWQPLIVGRDLGSTPIFNWLLYGYGVPAGAFWFAGHLLRRRADDVPARIADAAALLFAVLLAFLEIRHAMTGGDVYRASSGLAEVALQVSAGLAIAIGLEHLRQRTQSVIHNAGALIIAVLVLLAIVLGLLLAKNPAFTGEPVGGAFINLILLGYALPATLTVALAFQARRSWPQGYSRTAGALGVALTIAYFSLEVRTLYQGPILSTGEVSDAEQYTYSAVWLAFGVMLLALGAFLRSQPVRIASAAVVVLTVLKVFLVDMHDLTGIYQALSFIGLGAVLIGIGWFYQRLLFPRLPTPSAQPS